MRREHHFSFQFARAALLICSAALGGCIGGGLHSNQPLQEQYLLRAPGASADSASASTSAPAGALDAARSLEVLLPATAPGLQGDGIAALRTGGQLDYYTGARWAAAAPQMLQTLAIEAMRQQGRFALVESDSTPFAANWELQLELTHFEADYSGGGPPTVRIGLIATLGERNSRRAVTMLTIQTHALAQDDRMHAVVAAFQSATNEALQQIAMRLVLPSAASSAPAAAAGQSAP